MEGTINLAGNGNIYQPRQGPQNPNGSYNNNGSNNRSNHGFISFDGNNQGGYDQNAAPQGASMLGSLLGFSKLFGGANAQQGRPEEQEVDIDDEPPLLEGIVYHIIFSFVC